MNINPIFPLCRMDDPMRRDERQIYEAFEASGYSGHTLYEAKPRRHAPQIDFATWFEGIAIEGISVKGGRYIIDRAEWYLLTDQGRTRKTSPVPEAWDAAMAIHDVIRERLRRKVYVVPVLALPDMERDTDIEALAIARNVHVIFGTDRFVDRLVELGKTQNILFPPTAASIAEEVEVVMPELALPAAVPAGIGAQVLIQHVEQLHLHVGPEGVQGLSDLPGTG